VVTGCVRNQFDLQRYEEIVDEMSPVVDVDENHDWQLSTTKSLMVDLTGLEDIVRIQILTDNPVATDQATLVGEAFVTSKAVVPMTITYPNLQEKLYVAAIDSEERYTIVTFEPKVKDVVNFSNPIIDKKKLTNLNQLQIFTYLFEEEYPEPGDYDYNDIVVRLSMRRTGLQEVHINVELAAVGASKQLAFAIRLFGYKATDIEKVTTVDDVSFDVVGGVAFPDQMRTVMKEKDLLLTGIYQEAVLNIFADAHWATGDKLNADYGVMTRKRYNVSNTKNDIYGTFIPREITYVVTFKDGVDIDYLSLGQLDPFVIEQYNSANWEIHTYAFHNSQVLSPYPGQVITSLPWALCVPNSTFRWPIHAVAIGGRKQGASSGAYHTFDHSFGEWAQDKSRSTDWYLYPDKEDTYFK
jgi:LruC domain-containing protein